MWVLLRLTGLRALKGCETGPPVYRPYQRRSSRDLLDAEKVTVTSLEGSLKRKLLSCGKEYPPQRWSGSD